MKKRKRRRGLAGSPKRRYSLVALRKDGSPRSIYAPSVIGTLKDAAHAACERASQLKSNVAIVVRRSAGRDKRVGTVTQHCKG